MKKPSNLTKTLLLLSLLVIPISRADAQPPQSKEDHDKLFQTIASLDAEMFGAYNKCDLEKLGSFFTEDLEFYHDQTGLSRGRQSMIDSVKQYICGKVRRELVEGSLEVYPLQHYGAVEVGEHRFCDPRVYNTTCGEKSGVAKFVMLWQNTDGTWKITRVISYDHVSH
ncbi:MAG TPA: nuclear transport factor 2 family protein [Thermoanaerobaculia bacterium]|jgi:hypothetical protein|nr:nuclear transport factor 2 family protein [Thermoanaerobaculia bacterium]